MKDKKSKKVKDNSTSISQEILPADSEQGFLIVSSNKSALFINPPVTKVAERFDLQDIKNTIGDRALERVAKNKGQSGFKLNTDHSASIKFLNEKIRIDCRKDDLKNVMHEQEILTVPSYTPINIRKR